MRIKKYAFYHLTDENAKMKAMKEVVEKCVEDNILRDFLTNNREAVIHMEFYGNEIELREMAARSDGYDDGFVEGRKEGREEGREEGRTEGRIETKVALIITKLAKNKSKETIADEIEEDVTFVEGIVNAIKSLPKDASPQVIYQKYKELKSM